MPSERLPAAFPVCKTKHLGAAQAEAESENKQLTMYSFSTVTRCNATPASWLTAPIGHRKNAPGWDTASKSIFPVTAISRSKDSPASSTRTPWMSRCNMECTLRSNALFGRIRRNNGHIRLSTPPRDSNLSLTQQTAHFRIFWNCSSTASEHHHPWITAAIASHCSLPSATAFSAN